MVFGMLISQSYNHDIELLVSRMSLRVITIFGRLRKLRQLVHSQRVVLRSRERSHDLLHAIISI